jgi:hypothetical protein
MLPASVTVAQDPQDEDPFQDAPKRRREAPPDPVASESSGQFQGDAGQSWQVHDISRYTRLAYSAENPAPQNAIVEWIIRQTGNNIWHGEKLAVLSASRSKLRVYHEGRVLDQVADMVDRFTKAAADMLSVRVRFVAAADTRWRYAILNRLVPLATGPQGQTVWTAKDEDIAYIRAQLEQYQNVRLLADQTVKVVNGQTVSVKTTAPVDFVSGARREGAVGLGYEPATSQLEEGIVFRMSPLLTHDGDGLDAAIELTTNTVRRLIRTPILTRREVGSGDLAITVPETTETRLNQTVKNWPLSQALAVAGGITPGILGTKGGWLNLRIPGTVPTDTELLVFINASVEPAVTTRNTSSRRSS